MFKVENVSLLYDLDKEDKTYALTHINLEIKEGQFYGILGPSGSGKSSLLYLLSGIQKPTSGKVYYKGAVLSEMEEEALAAIRLKEFGFVFQKHFLIPYMDVLHNTLVPLNSKKPDDVEKAKSLLERLGLERELKKKPYELSGGQCQRVAVARALINEPKVLFADEITASLDHRAASSVMELLEEIKAQTTILFVTHDETKIAMADEMIYLREGQLGGDKDED